MRPKTIGWSFTAIVLIAYGYCSSDNDAKPAPPPLPPPPNLSYTSEAAEPTLEDELASTLYLSRAIRILKPYMIESRGEISGAASLLAIWSKSHLQWSDLTHMEDQKRVAIMKDPERFRGKLLCSRGSVIEIHADRSTGSPIYTGGLLTSSFDVVRFVAVGSTAGITKGSTARFCGIFTCILSYDNAMGGVTHAVETVGMFDVPSNL